jgi:lipid-A-disaccharide synthase
MIIVYKLSSLSSFIGRSLIKVKYAGLPNLIAGRMIVPELLQKEARADLVANEALSLLANPQRLARQRQELARIHESLGQAGVADRVAGMILDGCSEPVLLDARC